MGELSESFLIKTGIRQGDELSSFLFNVCSIFFVGTRKSLNRFQSYGLVDGRSDGERL